MTDARPRRFAALPGVVLACVVAGCATTSAGTSSEHATAVPAPSSGRPSPSDDPGSPDREILPRCRPGMTVAVGRSGLDASLGRRYLLINVRNCTSRPVPLRRPVVEVVTAEGGRAELPVLATPVAHRREARFVLAAGRTASAGLSWRAEPRDGRIRELRVAATDSDRPVSLPLHPVELRPTSSLDYYPWASTPDAVFSS